MAMGTGYLAWFLLIMDAFLLPAKPVGPATSGQEIFRYIPASSNLVLQIDVRSIKKQFDTSLANLSQQPFIAQNPMMKMLYSRMDMMLKQGIQRMERQVKVVKIDQIRYVTVGLSFKRRFRKPSLMVAVHGELNQKMIDQFAANQRAKFTQSNAHGISFYKSARRSRPVLGWTPAGQILLMTPDVAKELEEQGPAPASAGSLKARVINNYKPKHAVVVATRTSAALRREFRRVPPMIRMLAEDLTGLYATAWGGGSKVKVWGSNPRTVKRYGLILKGFGQMSVAGDYFRRGLIDVIDGVVDQGGAPIRNPMISSIMQFKPAILNYLRGMYGQATLSYSVGTSTKASSLTFNGNGGAMVPMVGVLAGVGLFVNTSRRSQRAFRSRPSTVSPSRRYRRRRYRRPTQVPVPVQPKKDAAKVVPAPAARPEKKAPTTRSSK